MKVNSFALTIHCVSPPSVMEIVTFLIGQEFDCFTAEKQYSEQSKVGSHIKCNILSHLNISQFQPSQNRCIPVSGCSEPCQKINCKFITLWLISRICRAHLERHDERRNFNYFQLLLDLSHFRFIAGSLP